MQTVSTVHFAFFLCVCVFKANLWANMIPSPSNPSCTFFLPSYLVKKDVLTLGQLSWSLANVLSRFGQPLIQGYATWANPMPHQLDPSNRLILTSPLQTPELQNVIACMTWKPEEGPCLL